MSHGATNHSVGRTKEPSRPVQNHRALTAIVDTSFRLYVFRIVTNWLLDWPHQNAGKMLQRRTLGLFQPVDTTQQHSFPIILFAYNDIPRRISRRRVTLRSTIPTYSPYCIVSHRGGSHLARFLTSKNLKGTTFPIKSSLGEPPLMWDPGRKPLRPCFGGTRHTSRR